MAKRKKRNRGHPARGAAARPAPASAESESALSPRVLLAVALALVVTGGIAFLAFGSGDDEPADEQAGAPETLRVPWIDPDGPTPLVGSLDVNRADASVWLSTNTGLWRVEPGADQPEQVTGSLATEDGTGEISEQLVVRFRGPNRLIGSGHPPPGSELPSALGLIESEDAGKTWSSISELGAGDFHSLQASGDVIIGGLFGQAAVSVSTDGGKRFSTRTAPSQLVDLAVDPDNADRLVASNRRGFITSADGGSTWRTRGPVPNIRFAWPSSDSLYRIDPGGPVKLSADGGETWRDQGTSGGEPQALFSDRPGHLYVALIDGTVKESKDGGATWTDIVTPPSA